MKKAIIAFLLASVLAGGAFGQITFSGSAYAGIRLEMPQSGDETLTTTHREEGAPKFNLTATVTRENYGARVDTTFQMLDDPARDFTLNGIYGWVDFLNNSLRLTMGQISSAAWVLNRWHLSHAEVYFDKIRGFRLTYDTPIDGLSVGTAVKAEGNDLQVSGERMIFGATFVHPMFSTVFAYDLGANGRALFGFNFIGIPDLTAGFQLYGFHLASWNDLPRPTGVLQMRQIVGYRVARPLSFYLISSQTIHGAEGSDVGLEFIPVIEYRFMPNLTGSFSVIIESPDHFSTTNLTLNPMLEKMLAGPALFYVEYAFHLPDMTMNRAVHTFGFGITVRAF
jgi:hypothetical protein